jgi:hypothetical protein
MGYARHNCAIGADPRLSYRERHGPSPRTYEKYSKKMLVSRAQFFKLEKVLTTVLVGQISYGKMLCLVYATAVLLSPLDIPRQSWLVTIFPIQISRITSADLA